MQTSPRGAIAHNVLLPRNFQIQILNYLDSQWSAHTISTMQRQTAITAYL